jgi:hypothetical protein
MVCTTHRKHSSRYNSSVAYVDAQREIELMEDIQLNVMSMDIVEHALHVIQTRDAAAYFTSISMLLFWYRMLSLGCQCWAALSCSHATPTSLNGSTPAK